MSCFPAVPTPLISFVAFGTLAGCPYILTVGGTQNFNPEGVVPYSGAGFSNFFQTPSFQSSVVGAYERELNITNNGYFNKTGRAYPDISAQAAPQPVIFTGKRHLCMY